MSHSSGLGLTASPIGTIAGRHRARWSVAALWGVVLAVVVVGFPAVAGAATAGAEVLVVPGTTRALTSGGSATPYGVVLPPGAACPGDTAHDGYHVFSYLVPGGSSATDVNFRTGTPSRWYGFIADGAYVGAVNTAVSTGEIVGLPTAFVWTRLTPQILFADGAHTSTWRGGIACADTSGRVTDYWNSTLVFAADPTDPGGFTWKVVDQGAVPSSVPVGLWVGIGLLVLAAGAGAFALRLRRRSRASDAHPDDGPIDGPAPSGTHDPDGGARSAPSEVSHPETVGR